MKLIHIALVVYAAIASAEEHPHGKMVQVCGAELSRGLKRVCEDGDLEFFNLQHVQHHHQHGHQHDHQHDHQHVHNQKSEETKEETKLSIVEECCVKPCHIKDFISYCP